MSLAVAGSALSRLSAGLHLGALLPLLVASSGWPDSVLLFVLFALDSLPGGARARGATPESSEAVRLRGGRRLPAPPHLSSRARAALALELQLPIASAARGLGLNRADLFRAGLLADCCSFVNINQSARHSLRPQVSLKRIRLEQSLNRMESSLSFSLSPSFARAETWLARIANLSAETDSVRAGRPPGPRAAAVSAPWPSLRIAPAGQPTFFWTSSPWLRWAASEVRCTCRAAGGRKWRRRRRGPGRVWRQ